MAVLDSVAWRARSAFGRFAGRRLSTFGRARTSRQRRITHDHELANCQLLHTQPLSDNCIYRGDAILTY